MARFSTNALTKRYAESRGWLCATVQTFYGGQRHDLFGIADSIVISNGCLTFVQNCSYGSLNAHCDAILESTIVKQLQDVGDVECWEWRRKKAKRGGKRISREWYIRMTTLRTNYWTEPTPWSPPLDLYPPTPRSTAASTP